jgi:site-specific recombinase XerD
MEADLKIGCYSPHTLNIYLLYARNYAKYFMRSPAEMGADEIRQFMLHYVEERKVSPETLRQVRSALRFLYTVTLAREVEVAWLPPPRRPKRLPEVLSGTEVAALLAAVKSLKYRCILSTIYSAGLRISEACSLRPEQIDSDRMVIRVQAGKGKRDRYTVLSERLLHTLRNYWRQTNPQNGWLFDGRTHTGNASQASTRRVFHKAVAAAKITKKVVPHTLRHCFATHMIESGVDVTVVQAMLGHASPRATAVYIHTSVEEVCRTRSPYDLLGTPQGSVFG